MRLYGCGDPWPFVTLATWRVNDALSPLRPADCPARGALALGARGRLHRPVLRARRPVVAGSCAFLLGLLVSAAAALYPVMLRSSGDPALSLTAPATAVPASALRTALLWWIVAFPLAIGYLVFLFRLHRGKSVAAADGEGY